MGGAALGRQAQRLSTPQFNQLIDHCTTRLSPSIFATAVALKPFTEKESHGDVDLLCSWDDEVDAKKVKGEDWGVIVAGEDRGVGAHHPRQKLSPSKAIEEKENKEGSENKAFRDWVVELTRTIGGTEWKRSGANKVVISIGVPCRVLEDRNFHALSTTEISATEQGDEPFYQVDIQLVPARYIQFTLFTRSYSNVILSHAVGYLSPFVKLHGTHLGIRYLPYVGLEPIKVELTASPVELCEWLGLDVATVERGFDNEKQLWLWATNVALGGKIDKAWKTITNPKRKSKEGKGKTHKAGAWGAFVAWLRKGEDSPYEYRQRMVSESETSGSDLIKKQEGETHVRCLDVTAVEQSSKSKDISVGVKEKATTAMITETNAPSLSLLQTVGQKSMVDPDSPRLLDKTAKEIIERFGRMRDIENLLRDRKEQAILLSERQKTKLEQEISSDGQRLAASDTTGQSVASKQVTSLMLQVAHLSVGDA